MCAVGVFLVSNLFAYNYVLIESAITNQFQISPTQEFYEKNFKTDLPFPHHPHRGIDNTDYCCEDDDGFYQQNASAWSHFRGNINNTGQALYAGPTSNNILWMLKLDAGANGISSSPAIDANGIIYLGGYDSNFYAITPIGSVLWIYGVNDRIVSSPAVSLNGTVYFGSDDYTFNAIDTLSYISINNVSAAWTFTAGYSIESSPCIDYKAEAVYVGSEDKNLYSIDMLSGSLKWAYKTGGAVDSSPAIHSNGNIIFGSSDKIVYCISSMGSTVWNFNGTAGAISYSAPSFAANGIIYIGSKDRNLYALHPSHGSMIWFFRTSGEITASAAVGVDSVIYVGSYDYAVYAIYPTGSLKWTFATKGYVESSPIIGGDNNAIYFGSNDYYIYAINTFHGSLLWKYQTGSSVPGCGAISSTGVLYIGSLDSYLYAFQTATGHSLSTEGNLAPIVIVVIVAVILAVLVCAGFVYKYRSDKDKYNDLNLPLVSSEKTKKNSSSQLSTSSDILATATRNVLSIQWSSIRLVASDPKEVIIGRGSAGLVIKASWNRSPTSISAASIKPNPLKKSSRTGSQDQNDEVVAIKVIMKTFQERSLDSKQIFEKTLRSAIQELNLIKNAEEKVMYKDCIIKVYGVVSGVLPNSLSSAFNVADNTEAVGIVMRYERGGSLKALIHNRAPGNELPLLEKLRVLRSLARGLAELHAVGIVHADIKPDNVLLSDSQPPDVRLADFGLSTARNRESFNSMKSSLVETSHTRGTPIYCAPELLHNPFADLSESQATDFVTKPSRKSDMYAFAVLAYEVLSEKVPFINVTSEVMLSSMVHQGHRPSLNDIPGSCPRAILKMIESCWSEERAKRKSAGECFSILNYYYGLFSKTAYDVYLSYDGDKSNPFVCALFLRLNQLGLKVYFNQTINEDFDFTSSSSSTSSIKSDVDDKEISLISSCKSFVPLISRYYHENSQCLQELRYARGLHSRIPIVPIFIDRDRDKWLDQEFTYLLQLRSTTAKIFDLHEVAEDDSWRTDEGPNGNVTSQLNAVVTELNNYIVNANLQS